MASLVDTVQKYGMAMDVGTLVVALWVAISGWVNMDMYARVGTYKDPEYKDKADKQDKVAKATVFIGLLVAGVLFGLLMFQGALSRGAYTSKKGQNAAIAQIVFAFVAFILVFLNVAYGIELFNSTATWSTKRVCDTSSVQATRMAAMVHQRKGKAYHGGRRADSDQDTAMAAKSDVDFQYATIGIAGAVLVAFIVYIGYFAKVKSSGISGGRMRPYAVSEFFTY